ncbi:MAG: hypothetical protein AAF541_06890 [Pseudomonadota bacterium]
MVESAVAAIQAYAFPHRDPALIALATRLLSEVLEAELQWNKLTKKLDS